MPEARVEQVQHRVLRAAYVQVDRHPVLLGLLVDQGLCIPRVNVAQVVPAAARPLRQDNIGYCTVKSVQVLHHHAGHLEKVEATALSASHGDACIASKA